MTTSHTAVIFGAGPRLRAISAQLAAAQGWCVSAQVETHAAALAAIAEQPGPAMLLDARCSIDRRCASERLRGAFDAGDVIFARAERANGDVPPETAAFIGTSGAALVRAKAGPPPAAGPIAGTWTIGPADAPLPALPPDAPGVAAYAHVFDTSGYATAGRNLLLGMRRHGVDVGFQNVWGVQRSTIQRSEIDALLHVVRPPRRGEPVLVYRPPTHAGGQAFLDRYRDRVATGPLIAATMFESDAIPAGWVAALQRCEAVWVPSNYGRESFVRSGVSPHRVHVVPIGIATQHYDPDGPVIELPNRRRHAFLSIFEWGRRKGPDVLLTAWARAFGPQDDVVLYIRTGSQSVNGLEMIARELQRLGLDARRMAPIVVLASPIPDAEWAMLFRSCDAFVLPTRGEGFCIPYVEAMAMGIPVIGVGSGGSGDFLDARTAFDIPVRFVPVDAAFAQEFPFYNMQRWAEPGIEATVAAMRAVASGANEAVTRAAAAFARVRTQFDRDVTGAIAARALAEVPARRVRPAHARFTLAAPVTALNTAGEAGRALLALAAQAKVPAAVERELPHLAELDAHDELRIADARERSATTFVVSVDGWAAGGVQFVTGVPADENALRTVLGAAMIWAADRDIATAIVAAGAAPERVRIVRLPIDTNRLGPDLTAIFADPRIVRFITTAERSRETWRAAADAFADAFAADEPATITLAETESATPERDAYFAGELQRMLGGRRATAKPLLLDYDQPKRLQRRESLTMHHIAVGPAGGPWPLDEQLASFGLARVPSDSATLKRVASDPAARFRLARRQRRAVVAGNSALALTDAFTEALDEMLPCDVAPADPLVDDVLFVVIAATGDPSAPVTAALVETTRALEGTVTTATALDALAAGATQRFIAAVPSGTWLPAGWDLQLLDALRRRFDADAVAALRGDDPAVPEDIRRSLHDPSARDATAHQFAVTRVDQARREISGAPPLSTVVFARTAAWRAGIVRCVVTEAAVCLPPEASLQQ